MRILPERYMANVIDQVARKPERKELSSWQRNVIDKYKNLTNDEIKARVEADRLPYAILMTHIAIDFNLATVIRVANVLGAKVFYYGEKKFDRRGTVGCHHYTPIRYLSSIDDVKSLKKEYKFVGLEQTDKSIPLQKYQWESETLIVAGEEACGLQQTPEIFELCEDFIEISQRGSIRSLNVANAIAIAAYNCANQIQ